KATKGESSKALTDSKIGHLKGKKESSLAMDSKPSQTLASTLVVAEMHKKDQQATGGPTSLGVTSEERSDPQLSSGMLAFNLNESIFSSSFIIHSESTLGNDALAVFTAKADPGKSAPSTDLHVLTNKIQSVSEGLETVLTQPTTKKRASSIARQVEEDEASRTIKLEDLAKLVDKYEEANEVYATTNVETKDTLVPKSLSPSSLPIELKELPSKFNELTEEVKGLKKQVHNLEIKLLRELKEIPTKLEDFTKAVTSLTS
nr:hypothetical protein [Tanacetum cinerariifolium]